MYFTVTYFNADFKVIFICANDVVRRRGYGDHFITMCVCGYVCEHDKTKIPEYK